jgi:hypothetical protein
VPHRLIRHQIEARITERTIELFRKGKRVAVHLRCRPHPPHANPRASSARRRDAAWTIERIRMDGAGSAGASPS